MFIGSDSISPEKSVFHSKDLALVSFVDTSKCF